MTEQTDNKGGEARRPGDVIGKLLPCERIRELLTDYMTRELGDSQSALVREHIRKCADCKAAAQDISETLDLLRSAGEGDTNMPGRLSARHRARIRRMHTHPVISWIELNHMWVSITAAGILVVIVLAILFVFSVMLDQEEEYGPIIPIRMLPRTEIVLDEIPEGDVSMEDSLTALLTPDGTSDAPTTAAIPPAADDGTLEPTPSPGPSEAQLAKAEEARRLRQLHRKWMYGLGFAGLFALLAALVRSVLGRRARSAEDDGTTEEGPPPVGE